MVAGYTLPRGGHLPARADVEPATIHGGLGDPVVDHGRFDFPAAHHGGVGPDKTAHRARESHNAPRLAPQSQGRTAAAPRPPAPPARRALPRSSCSPRPAPAEPRPTPRARPARPRPAPRVPRARRWPCVVGAACPGSLRLRPVLPRSLEGLLGLGGVAPYLGRSKAPYLCKLFS